MKILFLYLKRKGSDRASQINFDSDWSFYYDQNRRKLKVKYHKTLPQSFFSENKAVDSVSALIGVNGSGKTTIARYLSFAGAADNSRFRDWAYVAVVMTRQGNVEIRGYYQARWDENDLSNLPEDIRVHLLPKQVGSNQVLFSEKTPFVYCSPFYSGENTEGQWGRGSFYNLSTSALLFGKRTDGAMPGCEVSFCFDERMRALEVLEALHDRLSQSELPMVLPRSLRIWVALDLKHELGRDPSEGRAPDGALGVVDRFQVRYGVVAVLFTMLLRCLLKECPEKLSAALRLIEEFMATESSWWRPVWGNYVDFSREEFDAKWRMLYESTIQILDDGAEDGLDLFKELLDLACGLSESVRQSLGFPDSIEARVDEEASANRALRFHALYRMAVARGMRDCLTFNFGNAISSGEMSFITLFGRLYACLKKLPAEAEPTIFMDEAETTLHPEWQRKLVFLLCWFMETMFPGRHAHLIFASHSPLLLSDIPNGNVSILSQKQELAVHPEMKTFGANIFDLYRMSFFLQEGPIGEFATRKLKALRGHPDALVLDLVGDELLRGLLERAVR